MPSLIHASLRSPSRTGRPDFARRRTGRARAALGALLIAFSLGVAACSTTGGGARQVSAIQVDAARAAQLISAYRAQNGLGPVKVESRLMRVAARYARVMGERDKIKHGIGGSLPKRLGAAGYDWGYAAENLAASYSSLDEAMAGWKASPGHRRNLLSPYATEIGIAAVATPPGSEHRNYWALVLATPQPERVVAVGSIR